MSKVTLLSCPNPYCTADDGPRIWSTGVDCMTQCNHAVQCSCGITVAGTSIEEGRCVELPPPNTGVDRRAAIRSMELVEG